MSRRFSQYLRSRLAKTVRRTERSFQIAALNCLNSQPDTNADSTETISSKFKGKGGLEKTVYTLSVGKPDIMGQKGIISFKMELKKDRGILSSSQVRWRDRYLDRSTGWYFVVRDCDQVVQAWEEVGKICWCGAPVKLALDSCSGVLVATCLGCGQRYGRCTCPLAPGRIYWLG